jgi:AhpD family alkylhydroperoxidase
MTDRISLRHAAPQLYDSVVKLDRLASELAESAGMNKGFTHLLRLRASQLNQCAYCMRLHTRDALAGGESADRIGVLPAWRETEYFSDKERAALALIEAVTLVSEGRISDEAYAEAARALRADEVAAIEWLGVVTNAWNEPHRDRQSISGWPAKSDMTPSPHGLAQPDGSSVRVGALVPLSRPGWIEAGRHLLAGIELATREVNEAGGIAGRSPRWTPVVLGTWAV